MDSSVVEHSDSDSGESWSLVESSPEYGVDAPDFPYPSAPATPLERGNIPEHTEKDEDTDGISVISESDPESTPCEISYEQCAPEEIHPLDEENTPLLAPLPSTDNSNHDTFARDETDLLGAQIKHRTYVHRRNNKLGSILDFIMLGTFVVTVGMALGHLWGAKNECPTQVSVHKILSNLYKLQEENAYLRNKLKEVTMASNIQLMQQRKLGTEMPIKLHKCMKRFEEPLNNIKLENAIRCVDNKHEPTLNPTVELPEHQDEVLNDSAKLKFIYDHNKKGFDEHKKYEEPSKTENILNRPVVMGSREVTKTHRDINLKKQIGPTVQFTSPAPKQVKPDLVEVSADKKITYADSLKTETQDDPVKRNQNIENSNMPSRWIKDRRTKRKLEDDDIILNLNSISEEDFKKDDRYTAPKIKQERKKHDRQKIHKKHKRTNKYEQWEMKGGYLKDYDEFSITSQDNDALISNPNKKFLNPDFENYINKFTETEIVPLKDQPKNDKIDDKAKGDKRALNDKQIKKDRNKESEWYDKRSALRAEARTKLEHEMFGESVPNNAAWYFRRMHKREQCRAQKDNSTFKKFSKRKMNFKMKR